ncbi:MAG TPA: tRNA-binding protein [Candidatus Diapherotrites archaeon]|uniref:tRNA-binding protein n=1 Tax=Candidatus Iainarchaeum sp. TaxID=3101447 RepID=A0A7J4IWN0_9ARCH|nr:tRNA-binding protein [Candidatus Diapherotrites archaeon]
MATIEDFQKLDVRVGKIIEAKDFSQAKKPSYRLQIDLGSEIGIKKSCAQLVKNYSKEELAGKLVLCVVNFPARQIGPAISEVLTLGVPDREGNCILICPAREVPLGAKMY